MGIENIKWWMWVIISLPIGWLMAQANSYPVEPTEMRTDEQVYFEEAIMHPPVKAGGVEIPWVRNLKVYPETTALAHSGETQIMPVTYETLIPLPGGKAGEFEYEPSWFGAHVPYGVSRARGPATPGNPPGIEKSIAVTADATIESITTEAYGKDTPEGREAIKLATPAFGYANTVAELIKMGRMRPGQRVMIPWNPSERKTVQDWLEAAGKQYNWVHYQYAWWKEPQKCQMLWMGISVGLIGVVWPMTISILSGAGLSGRRVKEADYDLSRFGTGKSTAAPRVMPKDGPSEASKEQLAAMNEKLTAGLAADATDGSGGVPKPGAPVGAPAVAAKQLATETTAPPTEEQKSSRDYQGEFYPVAKGGEEKPKP
jgi:hypothetical protein